MTAEPASVSTIKLASYAIGGENHWGAAVDGGAVPATHLYEQYPSLDDFVIGGCDWQLVASLASSAPAHRDITYRIPLSRPGKIICVGVNFPERNAEYKDGTQAPPYMSLFPRFRSSFTGHNQPLIRPPESHKLDYEGEMAVIIGKRGRRIAPDSATDHIAALSICNEGTIRDWVRHAKFNVTQGKNWNDSGAIGPWIVPYTHPQQIENATIETRVNGETRQRDNTSRMMFPVREQIAYISTFTTLEAGDIIITGTPAGAGARHEPPIFLKPGDRVEVEVAGIGVLTNGVADEF